jgi:hypothetical protein
LLQAHSQTAEPPVRLPDSTCTIYGGTAAVQAAASPVSDIASSAYGDGDICTTSDQAVSLRFAERSRAFTRNFSSIPFWPILTVYM